MRLHFAKGHVSNNNYYYYPDYSSPSDDYSYSNDFPADEDLDGTKFTIIVMSGENYNVTYRITIEVGIQSSWIMVLGMVIGIFLFIAIAVITAKRYSNKKKMDPNSIQGQQTQQKLYNHTYTENTQTQGAGWYPPPPPGKDPNDPPPPAPDDSDYPPSPMVDSFDPPPPMDSHNPGAENTDSPPPPRDYEE